MNNKLKNGIVMAIALPLLLYLCYDIYTEMFPSAPSSGNVPASMDSLPKLPQNASSPSAQQSSNILTAQVPLKPDNSKPSANTANPPIPDPKTNPQMNPQGNNNGKDQPIMLASTSIFGENPFVEMSVLSQENRAQAASMLPAIPTNVPVPDVSSVPVPPPPTGIDIPTPPDGGMTSAPVVQTGTIETSSGARISLMSDGKVVSEDSSDDSIAFIGGGDAKIDDGKSIDALVNSIQVNRKQ